MIQQFKKAYTDSLHRIIPAPAYQHHIERLLKLVYEKGVFAPNDWEKLRKDSVRSIQLVDKNTANQVDVSDLYSFKTAYETLIYSDTVHYHRLLLQRCNLNEYIAPNLSYDASKSEATKQDLLSDLSWANGFVMNGQKIIDRGEIIDSHTYNILKSLEKEWNKRSETGTEMRLPCWGKRFLWRC
mgnify:FL=1